MNKHTRTSAPSTFASRRGASTSLFVIALGAAACSGVENDPADDMDRDLASEGALDGTVCPAGFISDVQCVPNEPDACTTWCEPAQPPTECPPKMDYAWVSFVDDGPFIHMCFPKPSAEYCAAGTNLHALCDDPTQGSDPACWICK